MTAPRIIEDFRKDKAHAPGHGYGQDVAPRGQAPMWIAKRGRPLSSEIIHSTNNRRPTSIMGEVEFIRDSAAVSCHDLIAKNGDVYVILPETAVAWHSGRVRSGFDNLLSFGTELHISIGERPTAAQIASLEYRLRQRRERYGIAMERVDTHRAVALPKGRKPDPEGWSDEDFYAWRHGLYLTPQRWFRVRYPYGANVREDKRADASIAIGGTLRLSQGDTFAGTVVTGTPWGGDDRWVHLADQRGFVHMSAVEAL